MPPLCDCSSSGSTRCLATTTSNTSVRSTARSSATSTRGPARSGRIAIAKSDLFALPNHIEPFLADALAKLAAEQHLRGLDRDRMVDRLTHYLAEINAAHPFREGNGRTQRAFISQLANHAGYRIAWERADPTRNIDASIAGMRGDNTPLRTMLNELVEPLSRSPALTPAVVDPSLVDDQPDEYIPRSPGDLWEARRSVELTDHLGHWRDLTTPPSPPEAHPRRVPLRSDGPAAPSSPPDPGPTRQRRACR